MSRQTINALAAVSLLLCACWCKSALGADSGAESSSGVTRHPTVDDATIERLRALHYSESHQVRLVLLPTSVTDKKGRTIQGLDQEDFRLFENREKQEIRFFSSEAREPISIAFVLDVSGSMRQLEKLEHAKAAIRFFVDHLQPRDRFALICFADDQVAWVTEFTRDRERFLRRLMVQDGYGQTALNDAVAATPGLVDERTQGRRAIILITDGVDNYSRLTASEAVELARHVHVPIYAIGFLSVDAGMLPKGAVETNLEVLDYVSRETGGRLFTVHDPDELKDTVAEVEVELRHQYVLGYYPTWSSADGSFRYIRVETSKGSLRVRTRSGYYAE